MLSWLAISVAWSFCGTYVGPADETPINNESRLVVVQNPDGTVLTMTSDATEAPDSFGLLMPVPSGVTEDDIEVVSEISALEGMAAVAALAAVVLLFWERRRRAA